MQRSLLLISGVLWPVVAMASNSHQVVRPVLIPDATGGSETHGGGSALGYPDPDSAFVVTQGVDRGADFSAPTDYPPERHAAFCSSCDTYFAFYEWNEGNDFNVSSKFWQTVGPIGFWSIQSDLNAEEVSDAGRPSAHETESGMAVAYHAQHADNEFDTWFTTYDWATQSWTSNANLDAINGTETSFPFLDRSSDGTWLIVHAGAIAGSFTDVGVYTSMDDGTTWEHQLLRTDANGTWLLPTGASDPTNGDLYIAYNDDLDLDGDGDVAIHRSTDGGATWTSPQLVVDGDPYAHAVEPSMVVDSQHNVHIVYQVNGAATYDGGLTGFGQAGPSGVPKYVTGAFDADNQWVGGEPMLLNSRENLAAIADSACGLPVDINVLATDSLSGMPQLGITHRPESGQDVLYVAYGQPYYAASGSEGFSVCIGWEAWMQYYALGDPGAGWSDRERVSSISEEAMADGRNAIYVHMTHDAPESGAGIVWSEMVASAPPADVLFARVERGAVGIADPGPGAPNSHRVELHANAPNPFNPHTTIRFELAEAGPTELAIFDASGRRLRMLVDEFRSAGSHSVVWNGKDATGGAVSSGVYFYRLSTGKAIKTRSMLLIK